MNDIEDRLRDAYRGATETVRPEAIRRLGEHPALVAPSARWWARGALQRLMVPLTAAAAVVVIGVVAGVVVPAALRDARDEARNHGTGAVTGLSGDPATHFLVGLALHADASYLSIRSAITGAAVATLAAPPGWSIGAVATGDGRSYVVALSRRGHCGSWLSRFTISRTGQPSRLTPAMPDRVWQVIDELAISRNGHTIALVGLSCPRPGGAHVRAWKPDLGVIKVNQGSKTGNTATGRYWELPSESSANSLSLTADGRLVEFSTGPTTPRITAIYVLPTNAAPGSAVQRGRVVLTTARFAGGTVISDTVMTPDGETVYFATYRISQPFNDRWALRAVDVASGRSRLIIARKGYAAHLVANPSVRELIAFVPAAPPPGPSPAGTPPPSPTGPPSALPTPVPSGSPVTPQPVSSGSASPVPSASPTQTKPQPSGSPSPAPSGSPSASPVPSGSPSMPSPATALMAAVMTPFDVIRIQVPADRVRYLNPVPWDVPDIYCVW